MEKTTVYLPDELKQAVKRAASRRGVSEAEVIRESIGRRWAATGHARGVGSLLAGIPSPEMQTGI